MMMIVCAYGVLMASYDNLQRLPLFARQIKHSKLFVLSLSRASFNCNLCTFCVCTAQFPVSLQTWNIYALKSERASVWLERCSAGRLCWLRSQVMKNIDAFLNKHFNWVSLIWETVSRCCERRATWKRDRRVFYLRDLFVRFVMTEFETAQNVTRLMNTANKNSQP